MTRRPRWHGFLRDNSLTLVFMVTFLMVLAGQALAAHRLYNEEQLEHHEHAVGLLDFLTSSRFAVEVTENWQSEFLQFALYIVATVWLVQRGSSESKAVGAPHSETPDEDRLAKLTAPATREAKRARQNSHRRPPIISPLSRPLAVRSPPTAESRWWRLPRDRLEQLTDLVVVDVARDVGLGDDPDEPSPIDHRQAPDLVFWPSS